MCGERNSLRCHLLKLLVLYVVTSVLVLPLVSYFLPWSRLYSLFHEMDKMHKEADSLNDIRLKGAQDYFNSLNHEESMKFYSNAMKSDIDIVVALITVQRKSLDGNRVGYLTQSVAKMDKLIKSDKSFKSSYLFLCNVDRYPSSHAEADKISKFIPMYNRYDNKSALLSERTELYKKTFYDGDAYYKETVDYMFCLETAFTLNSKYVLLLEDDTVPCLSLFSVLQSKLTNQKIHSMLYNQEFSHIKLYYPQRWQGFANEPIRITELLSYGAVGGALFLLIYTLVCSKCTKNNNIPYRHKMLYFVFGAVYVITVLSVIGRQTVLDLRRISPSLYYFRESPGCCTQAMLYSQKVIPDLVSFLAQDKILHGFHTDLAIYEFIKQTRYVGYQIEPNLFYHVGMYTSLQTNTYKHPQEFLFGECS